MSQYGIDQFVIDYFGQDFKGFYIESGASHPTDQSNTVALENLGWTGILIEPRTHHNEEYKIHRPNSIVENYALVSKNYTESTIQTKRHGSGHMYSIGGVNPGALEGYDIWEAKTLTEILKKHNITQVDFFSLDVEGYEHEALDGIDFDSVKFKMIIIEPHDYSWNGRTVDYGYLENYGYTKFFEFHSGHQVWVPKSSN